MAVSLWMKLMVIYHHFIDLLPNYSVFHTWTRPLTAIARIEGSLDACTNDFFAQLKLNCKLTWVNNYVIRASAWTFRNFVKTNFLGGSLMPFYFLYFSSTLFSTQNSYMIEPKGFDVFSVSRLISCYPFVFTSMYHQFISNSILAASLFIAILFPHETVSFVWLV